MQQYVEFKGYIKDPKVLLNLYRKSDIFIMLSKRETFGLVYIEAMSQGLPIIYSKGTGIDGYFEDEDVGIPIDIYDYNKDMDKIYNIKNTYIEKSKQAIARSREFDWTIIAKKYFEKIYTEEGEQ